tara:strand:+ start:77 stop:724 length:648 start_codon:yes stop_codon:yes gene_type:complete
MNIAKIDLPNPGVLQAELDKDQVDDLWKTIHKSSPDSASWDGNTLLDIDTHSKQWSMSDDGTFQKNVLMPMVEEYFKQFDVPFSHKTSNYHGLVLNRLWTRASTEGDYQSLHDHQGVFTFVVWMKVPFDGEDEHTVQGGFRPYASDFGLVYTNTCGSLSKQHWTLTPKMEGTILLFPSDINHIVYPHFTTKEYRISVAGDIALNSHAPSDVINPA